MNKQKKQNHKHEDCLLITSLSIDDCLFRLEAMANKDLEIESQVLTDYLAEVQFAERRNDDAPLYVTALVKDTKQGTCVTLNRRPYLKDESDTSSWSPVDMLSSVLSSTIFVLVVGGFATHRLEWLIFSLFCLLPSVLFLDWLSPHKTKPTLTTKTDSRRLNELMDSRYEMLRADVRTMLKVDPLDTRYDAVGNAYYVESTR